MLVVMDGHTKKILDGVRRSFDRSVGAVHLLMVAMFRLAFPVWCNNVIGMTESGHP